MTMTLERFKSLAESYGGDLARWPESEREAARALLISTSGALEPVLVEAAQLDRLLDLAPAQAADAALLGRLIAAAPQPLRLARRWLAGAGAALGLGAAALAGVAVGISIGQADRPIVQQEETLIAADFTADLSDALEEPAAL
ncbi:hypothetical protein [Caulobacter henricii]|uniref:Anti-sigma factor n=1 Tax=Caulobacter henricii TaxID=69395 RepID=A0A0P0NX10_9CAUL|nr:hypothetical protein [Caulobacter henricii]ALL12601.1 hypothetical protein AQ619_04085 [Caulobacter henricii]